MKDLKIVNLYDNANEEKKEKFNNNIEASLHIKINEEKMQIDTEWMDKIEFTIPYIENIFRNPNRFIINEEEIVKIELARKITVDSIKHLSKHTNLIQEIDKKTGDVRPSKILNINKEENYDTYENRLIYTLVQNMKIFIAQKKQKIMEKLQVEEKNEKTIEYEGKSKYNKENIQMNLKIFSKEETEKKSITEEIIERIEKIEQRIRDITTLEVYKIIDKKHVALIRPPIKKTNLVLKNVNFQYAVSLWNYLQQNMEDGVKNTSNHEDYFDNDKLKELGNETFLLNYLMLDYLENENEEANEIKENIKNNLINQMLDKIVDLESTLTDEQLKQLIGDKLIKIKYKKMATIEELQKIYIQHIDKYLEKVNTKIEQGG